MRTPICIPSNLPPFKSHSYVNAPPPEAITQEGRKSREYSKAESDTEGGQGVLLARPGAKKCRLLVHEIDSVSAQHNWAALLLY